MHNKLADHANWSVGWLVVHAFLQMSVGHTLKYNADLPPQLECDIFVEHALAS